jgi:hypothetical protein
MIAGLTGQPDQIGLALDQLLQPIEVNEYPAFNLLQIRR